MPSAYRQIILSYARRKLFWILGPWLGSSIILWGIFLGWPNPGGEVAGEVGRVFMLLFPPLLFPMCLSFHLKDMLANSQAAFLPAYRRKHVLSAAVFCLLFLAGWTGLITWNSKLRFTGGIALLGASFSVGMWWGYSLSALSSLACFSLFIIAFSFGKIFGLTPYIEKILAGESPILEMILIQASVAALGCFGFQYLHVNEEMPAYHKRFRPGRSLWTMQAGKRKIPPLWQRYLWNVRYRRIDRLKGSFRDSLPARIRLWRLGGGLIDFWRSCFPWWCSSTP